MSMYHLFLLGYGRDNIGDYVDAFDTLDAAWKAIRDKRPFGYWMHPVLMQFDGGNLKRVGELSVSARYEEGYYSRRATTYGWQIGDTFTEMETIYEQYVITTAHPYASGIAVWQVSDPF